MGGGANDARGRPDTGIARRTAIHRRDGACVVRCDAGWRDDYCTGICE